MASRLKTTVKNSGSKDRFSTEEILDLHKKLFSSSVDLFRLLGLEYPVTAEDLRKAYDDFLQKFNRLIFSASPDTEIVEKANDIFDEVSEIFDTMTIGFNLVDLDESEVN